MQILIFDVVDPRGKRVICTEDSWTNHVLAEHPFMRGRERDIQDAIENPYLSIIYQDRDYPNRNVYYKLHGSRTFYYKAVVEFTREDDGELITAFKTDSPKSGEYIVWPTSSA